MINSEKWEKRFLDLAKLTSTWSKDPSTKVAAVCVDSKRRVIGMGYNGFPRNANDDDRLHVREEKYKITTHAEVNCILNSVADVEGATMVLTHPPCKQCCSVMAQAGIAHVVFEDPTEEFKSRWNLEESLEYLEELNISVTRVPIND